MFEFTHSEKEAYVKLEIIMEVVFGIEFLMQFFTLYRDENGKPIMGHKNIAMRYLQSYFVLDLITLVPFSAMLATDWNRAFYSLKCLRLYSAYTRLFDIKVLTF